MLVKDIACVLFNDQAIKICKYKEPKKALFVGSVWDYLTEKLFWLNKIERINTANAKTIVLYIE